LIVINKQKNNFSSKLLSIVINEQKNNFSGRLKLKLTTYYL